MTESPAKIVDLPHVEEVRTFLAATAKTLRETVSRFEHSAARVMELVLTQPDHVDRDLVVALQDFDRLQQEFASLTEVLIQAGDKSTDSWLRGAGEGHPAEDVIERVSIAELKERLLAHLGANTDFVSEDVVF
jgi:hypothetical protein